MAVFSYEETQMYYEEVGEGIPFLLIHGWAIDHRFLEKCMEPIFYETGKKFRRIYVDLPGMGKSVAGKVRNGDDITDILIAFMNEIAADEKFYICGNSFGSVLARAITANLGDRVRGLILLSPALDRKQDYVDSKDIIVDENFASTLSEDEREAFIFMHANLNQETYDRYRELVYPSIEINKNNEFLRGKLKGTFGFDINKKIYKSSYNGPTLILTGKNDRAVGYAKQYEWLDIFENASYFVINNAGHNIHVDQPAMFQGVVSGFVECLSDV